MCENHDATLNTARPIIVAIEAIPGVQAANLWTRGLLVGKNRIYVELESQNRFAALGIQTLYVDLDTREVITTDGQRPARELNKKLCAGAATYRRACEIVEKIKSLLEN